MYGKEEAPALREITGFGGSSANSIKASENELERLDTAQGYTFELIGNLQNRLRSVSKSEPSDDNSSIERGGVHIATAAYTQGTINSALRNIIDSLVI